MRRKIICLALAACLACGTLGGCQGGDPYGISKEEFDQLRIGMDKSKVVNIISDNVSDDMRADDFTEEKNKELSYWNLISESEDSDGNTTYIYTIKGEKGGEAKLTFFAETTGEIFIDYSKTFKAKENNGL